MADVVETSPTEAKATQEAVENACGSDTYDSVDEASVTPKTWIVVFVSGICPGFRIEVPKLTISKILSMGYGYVV